MSWSCCGCFRWNGWSKDKYKYQDVFDEKIPFETALTQLLIDDDADAAGSSSNNHFITQRERDLLKEGKYDELRRIQQAEELKASSELASQEAKVEVEEERRFREERVVLFGDESNAVTEQPKASRQSHSNQKRSGVDRERTGSTSQHASVSLHAVSEARDSPDEKQLLQSRNDHSSAEDRLNEEAMPQNELKSSSFETQHMSDQHEVDNHVMEDQEYEEDENDWSNFFTGADYNSVNYLNKDKDNNLNLKGNVENEPDSQERPDIVASTIVDDN